MKKSTSRESNRVRRPGSSHLGKATPHKKQKSASATSSPAPTSVTAKLAGLLAEHCPAPKRVHWHLRLYRPQAHEVFVAGAFNDWQPRATPLLSLPDGEWAVDLMLRPGRYEYRYVVDGQWMDDPMALGLAANSFGGLNSVMEVRPSA